MARPDLMTVEEAFKLIAGVEDPVVVYLFGFTLTLLLIEYMNENPDRADKILSEAMPLGLKNLNSADFILDQRQHYLDFIKAMSLKDL